MLTTYPMQKVRLNISFFWENYGTGILTVAAATEKGFYEK